MAKESQNHLGVLLLNFGEPEVAHEHAVLPFLEKIFYTNAPLERFPTEEARIARSKALARERAPGLIEDYQKIGGSPLAAQAELQSRLLEHELHRRGLHASTFVGMQFTEPSIGDALKLARTTGVDGLVALPVYPFCGHSTTIAALDTVRDWMTSAEWECHVDEISGWHAHPGFTALHVANILRHVDEHEIDLFDHETILYFSAHGTPLKYLEMGSRYDGYVEEQCSRIASALGGPRYVIGYQNHSNRGIAWTPPDNTDLIDQLVGDTLVVVPISFAHEQSETLVELDIDFRHMAESKGFKFSRVGVPFKESGLTSLLADLVTQACGAAVNSSLSECRCRPGVGTYCTNGNRDVDCHFSRNET